jgi:hypothetical protein
MTVSKGLAKFKDEISLPSCKRVLFKTDLAIGISKNAKMIYFLLIRLRLWFPSILA